MDSFWEKTKKTPIDIVMRNCSATLSRECLILFRLSVVKEAVGCSLDESSFIVRISDRVCWVYGVVRHSTEICSSFAYEYFWEKFYLSKLLLGTCGAELA